MRLAGRFMRNEKIGICKMEREGKRFKISILFLWERKMWENEFSLMKFVGGFTYV